MCPSAPRVCSEPGGQKPVLALSLDLISQHWFRWWLGTKPTWSHYLNQCWPTSIMASRAQGLNFSYFWPWPISSRSVGHEFVMETAKIWHICLVHSGVPATLSGLFPYLAQMIIRGVSCIITFGLDLYLQGHSAMNLYWKLKKYCNVRCVQPTVLNGFFP